MDEVDSKNHSKVAVDPPIPFSLEEALDVSLKPPCDDAHLEKIKNVVVAAKQGDLYAQFACCVTFLNLTPDSYFFLPWPVNHLLLEILSLMRVTKNKIEYYLPVLEENTFRRIKDELYGMILSLHYFNPKVEGGKLEYGTRKEAIERIYKQWKKLKNRHIHQFFQITGASALQYRLEYYKKNYQKWFTVFDALNAQNPGRFPFPKLDCETN